MNYLRKLVLDLKLLHLCPPKSIVMKNLIYVVFCISAIFFVACRSSTNIPTETKEQAKATMDENPPAPGFNLSNSDPQAIEWADKVMKAMGGRQNWDKTRFISWNFFGRRQLIWDKNMGKTRITAGDMTYLIDLKTNTGRVKKGDVEYVQPDSIAKYVEMGKNIWINDSYWLVMPYKLKDSGVTLKYMGPDTTANGKPAEKLQLTFENVGVTPQNKYWVYVDPSSNLVAQWDFYRNASDETPSFSNPWDDYQQYGHIKLSGGRGGRGMNDIQVFSDLPESVFNSFDAVDLSKFK